MPISSGRWRSATARRPARLVINGDGQPLPADAAPGDGLPRFRLKSDLPRALDPLHAAQERRQFRRSPARSICGAARTNEAATPANPQYRSKIVSESVRLNEEEIPRSGLRVRRIARYARGSDGQQHFWVGRLKESGQRTALPGLRFDFIEGR